MFLAVFFLVLATININNSTSSSNSIDLKPPNLSGKYRDNRPPFPSSRTLNQEQNDLKLIPRTNEIYPCNGTYLKTNGTTCGLKEIMIGRCYEYQYIKRGLYLSNTT
jgi:hypothetical protein